MWKRIPIFQESEMTSESKPLVSIVIPCYNAEKWIRRCMLSVFIQDYPNLEIIVVDDASTDKSANLIVLGKVKLIKNETNLGECQTSQKGFMAATGKYVCRLSADDEFVCRDHISRQVAVMEKYSLDWCYNSVSAVGPTIEKSVVSQTAWMPIPIRYGAWVFHIFDNLILKFPMVCYLIAGIRNPINSSALMFRTETFRSGLSWNDSGLRSVCDAALLADVFLHGLKGRAIAKMGSFYRIHEMQATGKPEANENLALIRKAIYEETLKPEYPFWVRLCSEIIMAHILKVPCGQGVLS
jgi:glycosyltransferase involved in cell wall biosynthesis